MIRSIVGDGIPINALSGGADSSTGCHDHNYWQLNSTLGLFMYEVITKWVWGKFVAGPSTVIFIKTWMSGVGVRSIMVSEHDKIVFCTDENLTITVNKEMFHAPLKSRLLLFRSLQQPLAG
jgi:hypothetical protein